MFRGASKITLDAKGRLAIPSRYRERLVSRAEGRLVATVDYREGCCLLIYPFPDWKKIERKLLRLSSFDKQPSRLQRLMVGYAKDLDMDGQGRVLLPRELRDLASLDKRVMLLGQGNKFELWDEERWNGLRDEWLAVDGVDGVDLPKKLKSLSL